jgi:hypothetical protein
VQLLRHPLAADVGLGLVIAAVMLVLQHALLSERWARGIIPSLLFGALYVVAIRFARAYPSRDEPGGRRAVGLVLIEAAVVLVLAVVLAVVL